MTLTFGSLFAGIGGMDLGLERAGMRCVWQVEIDPYARRILGKHWPDVPRWDDVRTFPPEPADAWRCNLIAGGFPCQDISDAGPRTGLRGKRSGLWFEFARVIRLVRPRLVLVENVAALLGRGLGRVLGDLAALGYDAEWDVLPAAAVGAPHLRQRVFVLAHARHEQSPRREAFETEGVFPSSNFASPRRLPEPGRAVAHPDRQSLEVGSCFGKDARQELAAFERGCREGGGVWATEPCLDRVANGVPCRVERLRGLGNAVVPQVAEWIGRRILRAAGADPAKP